MAYRMSIGGYRGRMAGGDPQLQLYMQQFNNRQRRAYNSNHSRAAPVARQRRPSLWDQYQAEYNEAKQRNLALEQELKEGHQERIRVGMEGYGQQRIKDINEMYDDRAGRVRNDLISRGLTGSTLKPIREQFVERERDAALNRFNDHLSDRHTGLMGDALAQRERVSYTYPDLNRYDMLAQQEAESNQYSGARNFAAMMPRFVSPQSLGYQMPNYPGVAMGGRGRVAYRRPRSPARMQALREANEQVARRRARPRRPDMAARAPRVGGIGRARGGALFGPA